MLLCTCMCLFLCRYVFISLGYIPNSEIAGTSKSLCNLLRNCQTVFQKSGMIWYDIVATDHLLDNADLTVFQCGAGIWSHVVVESWAAGADYVSSKLASSTYYP